LQETDYGADDDAKLEVKETQDGGEESVGERLCCGGEHGGVWCGKHGDEAAARQNASCVSNSS